MAAAGLVDTVVLALIWVFMVLIAAVMAILVAALHSGVATKALDVATLGMALAGDIRITSVVLVETGTLSKGNRVIQLGQISMGIGEILVGQIRGEGILLAAIMAMEVIISDGIQAGVGLMSIGIGDMSPRVLCGTASMRTSYNKRCRQWWRLLQRLLRFLKHRWFLSPWLLLGMLQYRPPLMVRVGRYRLRCQIPRLHSMRGLPRAYQMGLR
jgi:hypothetical protein